MIGYLQGEIIEYDEGRLLVAVGDRSSHGCVGYSVSVAQRGGADGLYLSGEKIELFIYSHIREEAFDLYGFSKKSEKELFLTLLSVNGVGPKSALGILASTDPSQLMTAILQADQAVLTRIPGIGKKTAERLIVELRDTIRKKVDSGLLSFQTKGSPSEVKQGSKGDSTAVQDALFQNAILRDARDALLGLGYREQDVQSHLSRIIESLDTPPRRAEDLIRTALRQLT